MSTLNNKENYQVGSVITFGKYAGEDIKWRILDIKDDKALILTDEIIEAKCFSGESNYEKSEVREWLNGEFYNMFTKEEKKHILKTLVDNSLKSTGDKENPYACNNTEDYIFLLSNEEVKKYFKDEESRICKGTKHAIGNRLFVFHSGNSIWWIRSPYQYDYDDVQCVNDLGMLSTDEADCSVNGVRPACWIKL